MPDIRGLLSDPEFRALPPERQQALLAKINPALAEEFAAVAAPAVEDPVLGTEAPDPRLDPERMSFRGASSMATSEPQRQEMTPLESAVTATGATIALGALGGGTGIVPAAARLALSPAGSGVISGVTTLAKTGSPLAALGAGLTAATTDKAFGLTGKLAKFVLKPAEKARVAHAVKRSIKEAVEEAPKVAPIRAVAKATPVAPDMPVEDILADMQKRVTSMRDLGIDPKDISKSLVRHYEQTGRGAGLTAGKMRSLVDEIVKASPKAETNLADDMASHVLGWTKEGGGKVQFTRAQMDAALRDLYPVELTPSKAREVVDLILDTRKIGPKRTAAEMGMSTNEQIRATRAAQAAKGGS
jgi:hypothetical protein